MARVFGSRWAPRYSGQNSKKVGLRSDMGSSRSRVISTMERAIGRRCQWRGPASGPAGSPFGVSIHRLEPVRHPIQPRPRAGAGSLIVAEPFLELEDAVEFALEQGDEIGIERSARAHAELGERPFDRPSRLVGPLR